MDLKSDLGAILVIIFANLYPLYRIYKIKQNWRIPKTYKIDIFEMRRISVGLWFLTIPLLLLFFINQFETTKYIIPIIVISLITGSTWVAYLVYYFKYKAKFENLE